MKTQATLSTGETYEIDPTERMVTPNSMHYGTRNVDVSRGETRYEVTRQWMNRPADQRFVSLDDLAAHTRRRYEASSSLLIDNKKLELVAPEPKGVEDLTRMYVGLPGGDVVSPTHWSFGQMAGLVNAPASYLRKLPSQIAADCFRWGLSRVREVEQVKTYHRLDSKELLAVTGPGYGRIPDFEVVETVRGFAEAGAWKVPGMFTGGFTTYNPNVEVTKDSTTLFASDRDVFIFLVDDLHPIEIGKLPNGDPDLVFRGFYVENSEVGNKSMRIGTMYLRGVCCNRILWGVEGFSEMSIRHSSGAPDRFMMDAAPALRSFSEGSVSSVVEGVAEAKQARIATNDEEALEWLQARKFTKKQAADILTIVKEEEGHPARSVWDVVQGATAVARKAKHNDARLDIERAAGKLLDKVA